MEQQEGSWAGIPACCTGCSLQLQPVANCKQGKLRTATALPLNSVKGTLNLHLRNTSLSRPVFYCAVKIPRASQTHARVSAVPYAASTVKTRLLPLCVVDRGPAQDDPHARVGAVEVVDSQRLFIRGPSNDEHNDILGPAIKTQTLRRDWTKRGDRSCPAHGC